MGMRLKRGFELAKNRGGVHLVLRLAMLTKISNHTAETLPDETGNIETMTKACKRLGIPYII